jgi:hypothetical protein
MSSNDLNDNISSVVKLWLEGNTKIEYIDTVIYKLDETMADRKKILYNLIMTEIQKQLNTTDKSIVEEKLGGELFVCLDEEDMKAFITGNNYNNIYDTDDSDYCQNGYESY